MPIEEIKEWYNSLCHLGYNTNPLLDWFVLMQLINTTKKNKLTGNALIVQEYYKLARMVNCFQVMKSQITCFSIAKVCTGQR